ncbi:MAG: galactonate dehydratase [Armatimonadetes bacterium]|nr:galactonate dehydratase [Armatimonadota bacterium]
MKITAIRPFLMRAVERNWLFVKVETDAGLYGWGEASLELKERTVAQALLDLEPFLLGQDPTRIEHCWQILHRHGFWRGGVVLNSALSGIDQALWDLTGKAYGVPVYKLLGGAVRDRIRLYAHGGPRDIPAIREAGFTAVKSGPGVNTATLRNHAVAAGFRAHVEALRAAGGDDCDVMIDNHGTSTPQQAIQMLAAVEDQGLLFFEEPCPPDNPDTIEPVARCGFRTPLATGERLYTRWGFKTILERQLVSVIQPDLCHAGGISEVRRIAAAAETYHIRVAPHNPYGPVSTVACLHLCAAIPNFFLLEYVWTNEPWRSAVQEGEPIRNENGYLELPDRPGLGIDLKEEVIAARPFEAQPVSSYQRFDQHGAAADA